MKIFGRREEIRENPLEDMLDGLPSFTYPDGTTITKGMEVTLAGESSNDKRIVTSINWAGEFMLLKLDEKGRGEVVGAAGPYRIEDINLGTIHNRENRRWEEVDIYIGMPVKVRRNSGVLEGGWVVTAEDAGSPGFVIVSCPSIKAIKRVSTMDLKRWQIERK